MNIDIKKIKNIKDDLATLQNEVAFIDEDNHSKYVIMPIEMYNQVEKIVDALNNKPSVPIIKVGGLDNFQLTYEEYEKIKKQLNEIVDKTLKPKPEKLN